MPITGLIVPCELERNRGGGLETTGVAAGCATAGCNRWGAGPVLAAEAHSCRLGYTFPTPCVSTAATGLAGNPGPTTIILGVLWGWHTIMTTTCIYDCEPTQGITPLTRELSPPPTDTPRTLPKTPVDSWCVRGRTSSTRPSLFPPAATRPHPLPCLLPPHCTPPPPHTHTFIHTHPSLSKLHLRPRWVVRCFIMKKASAPCGRRP